MKTLRHLEKKRFIWFLIGISAVFFLLRLPSLIEPDWYGDEGVYQVISLALHNGRDLYSEIWDNKPPLLYLTYALFIGEQFSVRLLSLFFGISSTILFFLLSRKLLKNDEAAGAATVVFTVLFATPFLEGNIANAENFMLVFTIASGLLIYTIRNSVIHKLIRQKLFSAGFLLGIAFLYKIVAFYDFAAFGLFLFITSNSFDSAIVRNRRNVIQRKLTVILAWIQKEGFLYLWGFLLPIFLAFLYFILRGTFIPFIQSAFLGNIGYVGYGNQFIIPQGFLIIKLILLACAICFIVLKRRQFSPAILFISLWFVLSVFSAFFSQRQYTHYSLVMIPSLCLLIGLFFVQRTQVTKLRLGTLIVVVVVVIQSYFHSYGLVKTTEYYQNAISFLLNQKSVNEYRAFFDAKTPRDYELASYIKARTVQTDQIFIWGDSPQIYYLAQKLPPTKYTVAYHILQDPNGVKEAQAAIDKIHPKFIITLSEAPPLPLQLSQYVGKYGIKGSTVYERTF